MGRNLQRVYNVGKEQAILMMPILEGLDGVNKMSKSLGNYIGVSEDANTMFAKIMSISDELMWRYYELLSFCSSAKLKKLQEDVKNNLLHPKDVKVALAKEIVQRFHSEEKAQDAQKEFDRVHKNKEIPQDLKEFEFDNGVWIGKAFVEAKLVNSTSELRRKINEGGAKLDSKKITDFKQNLQSGEYIAQIGRKKFAKLKVK
jgi:tyrosyl-tRNA synthetase